MQCNPLPVVLLVFVRWSVIDGLDAVLFRPIPSRSESSETPKEAAQDRRDLNLLNLLIRLRHDLLVPEDVVKPEIEPFQEVVES